LGQDSKWVVLSLTVATTVTSFIGLVRAIEPQMSGRQIIASVNKN